MSDPRELIQGSEDWKLARCGSLGASSIHEAVARTKTGWGASRANLMARLLAERLTGVPQDTYQSQAMVHGTETEPYALAAYEFYQDAIVERVGLVPHPSIAYSHASPDGLVGADGLVEVKCPGSATHIDTLLGQSVPGRYVAQMQWQMACTGRAWCDFVSFDPRMPEDMRLFVRRVQRDSAQIADLEKEIRIFLSEIDGKIEALTKKVSPVGAALRNSLIEPTNLLMAG
jgi:putative phage-type endonuclease